MPPYPPTRVGGDAPSRQGVEYTPLFIPFGQVSLAFQLDCVPERSVTVCSGYLYAATGQ
jgi:hypothetical protein